MAAECNAGIVKLTHSPAAWTCLNVRNRRAAVWSYMLAARARGLGTVWTDPHLRHEKQVSGILGLPSTPLG